MDLLHKAFIQKINTNINNNVFYHIFAIPYQFYKLNSADGILNDNNQSLTNWDMLLFENKIDVIKYANSCVSFYNYIKMIKTRKRQSAFHPNSDFEILEIDPKVFVIARYAKDQIIYAVTNISSKRMVVSLSGASAPLWMKDLITGVSFRTDALKLNPYQFLWLSTMDR